MFGFAEREELTARQLPEGSYFIYTSEVFFFSFFFFYPVQSNQSEKTACMLVCSHMHNQGLSWVQWQEHLNLVSSSLSPDKLINTINGLIYTLGLKFDTRTLSWLRKHKWFCARGFNDRSVI